ncbi:hypothetical protein KCMC57_up62880 [Kitasatospora sp. CMC57]|uniref:DDE Tnp4 domain-containing protein n=1 Tax=Kitasatospora sp. CMC57 TaxID=3231513 RepID=A0AB33K523_9ACTN
MAAQEIGFRQASRGGRALSPGHALRREADAEYVLGDDALTECDRVGDGRSDHSGRHRRHGVNLQVTTGARGRLVWISRPPPGRTHDLTAAPRHRIVKTCGRLRIPALADTACTGAGGTFAISARRPPGGELTTGQRSIDQALARQRSPRRTRRCRRQAMAHLPARPLKPNRLTSAANLPGPWSRPGPGEKRC